MKAAAMTPAAKGHLAMLAFSALVGGSFSLGATVANDLAPTALTAVRFLLAGTAIGAAALLGSGLRRWQFRAPWRFLLLGAVYSVYFVLMFEGLKTAPPVATAAVFTLTPVMSAGFGWLLLRQVTTLRMAAALLIGAVGALWVIFRADLSAFLAFEIGRGEAIYFVGCIAHAAYPALVRRLNWGEPVLAFTFGTMLAAVILLTLYGLPELRAADWRALGPHFWAVLAYLAFLASALTFVLVQYGALRLPSAKVMAYTYLVPSWVTVWEIALGNGVPRVLTLAGVVLSIAALVLLLKNEEAAPAPAENPG